MDFYIASHNFYNQYSAFNIYRDRYSCYSIFFRAKIKVEFKPIKEQNTFAPQHTFQRGQLITYTQRFLRIRVRNSGYRTLHNCQAELRLIIQKGDDPMRYPSDNAKPLAWGRHPQSLYDLTQTRHIQGHGSQLLHVIFSDSHFATTHVNAPKRYACISTIERLAYEQNEPRTYGGRSQNLTVEDSFTNGDFEIEITITSDEGPYKRAKFNVIIDTDYGKLTMRKLIR
jgi:hypothetical protein